MLDTLRNLPRTGWIVGLISLGNDSASEMWPSLEILR